MNSAPSLPRGRGLLHRASLAWEVVTSGLRELWAHKMRSILTLTLLMLGVFALVVMTSVLDGIMDKIGTGFSGMSWDGTLVVAPKSPETSEEQVRFAMSPGLRMEDLTRITAPNDKVVAFMPRASKQFGVRVAGGTERIFVTGNVPEYIPVMNRRIASGRGLTGTTAGGAPRWRCWARAWRPSSWAAPIPWARTSWWTASPSGWWGCSRP